MNAAPWGASEIGDRSENQDAWSAGVTKNLRARYAIVADGMGGHPDGARCAASAVEGAASYLSLAGHKRNRVGVAGYAMRLGAYVQRHLAIAHADGMLDPDAGVTFAAALVVGDIAWLITVGDCRCIVVRAADVLESTVPHNRLANALRDGEVVEDDLDRRDLGSLVTRWITPAAALAPRTTVIAVPLESGDQIAVASDGVGEVLSPATIARMLNDLRNISADDAAAELVSYAVNVSTPVADNATAVILRIATVDS